MGNMAANKFNNLPHPHPSPPLEGEGESGRHSDIISRVNQLGRTCVHRLAFKGRVGVGMAR